jgi:hypothetical protein
MSTPREIRKARKEKRQTYSVELQSTGSPPVRLVARGRSPARICLIKAHDGSAGCVSAQPSIREMIMHGGDKSLPMPSFSDMKAFLKKYHKHESFEERDNSMRGEDYSDVVTQGNLDELEKYGFTCISHFESINGRSIWFDRSLEPMERK